MVVEFREFGGVLATQRKIRMNLETTFYLHGHGNQLLNKIENKQHVQMSFRCVLFAEIAVSFLQKLERICLDVQMHPVRDVCVRTHFSSQGQKAQKGPSLVQSRNKDRNNSRTAWLFPSVRWSKSRIVSDGLCV